MTAPTRIDPVDWADLCELALRERTEAAQNAALLEVALRKITRMIKKMERENKMESGK